MSRLKSLFQALCFFSFVWRCIQGDIESSLARCCALGANWARDSQKCINFPSPVPNEASEHQSICITAASICCLRVYRESQCESGKQAAQTGLQCVTVAELGGESFKDCCDGCKLGLVAGSMASECKFGAFTFGHPWNGAYLQCCSSANPELSNHLVTVPPESNVLKYPELSEDDDNFIFTNRVEGHSDIPDSENLCLLFPGQLCGHVCVPTRGSYICQCRAGFSLSVDGKTCIQAQVTDRCKLHNPCEHTCQDTGLSTECSCNPGFQLNSDQRTCKDIDECQIEIDPCGSGESCLNTQGSYRCLPGALVTERPASSKRCPAGYKFNTKVQSCEDVDECENGLFTCAQSETCVNSIGAFECHQRCDPGFVYSPESRQCQDVNECSDPKISTCNHARETCVNTMGSFRCDAKGSRTFSLQGQHSQHSQHSQIFPTSPPLVEECPNGYGFDLNTRKCLDIDECTTGFHNCSQFESCLNVLGGFSCRSGRRCNQGSVLNPQNGQCEDVDECDEGLAVCLPGQVCYNTDPGFDCRVECKEGFRYDPSNAAICVDINECLLSPCGSQDVCLNTEGSYSCIITSYIHHSTSSSRSNTTPNSLLPLPTPTSITCLSGMELDVETLDCKDIDECSRSLHDCHPRLQQCFNTPGSFRCKRKECSRGFAASDRTGDCEDVNECENLPCSIDEECINMPGSFLCRVRPACQSGFVRNQPHEECQDIDECASFNSCRSGETCINTKGSYRCRSSDCPAGYQRSKGTGQCVDVNECLTGEHACKNGERCQNHEGSYRCRKMSKCPKGFTRSEVTGRCVDVDECELNLSECLPVERCVNQYGKYACRATPLDCTSGYIYLSTERRCQDIDECADGSHTCSKTSQTCTNTLGSFQCKQVDGEPTCDLGYAFNSEDQTCIDVDECEIGRHLCSDKEICVNLPGSYICDSKSDAANTLRPTNPTSGVGAGSRLESETSSKDLPTTPSPTVRATTEQRTSEETESTEKCLTGYHYNSFFKRCTEINECESTPCGRDEQCINVPGSYLCDCRDGFIRDSLTICRDINECQLGNHHCNGWQRCDNTVGSYTCTRIAGCGTGYTLNQNTGQCEDNDECVLDLHDCKQLGPKWGCVNTKGSFRCEKKKCPENQILNSWGLCANVTCTEGFKPVNKLCEDINECFVGTVSCILNERCVNTVGSYRCVAKINCGRGYEMNERGTLCVDVDECGEGIDDCDSSQLCINRPGGYVCQCPTGHRLEGSRNCRDVDECTEYYTNVCGKNGKCRNTVGSYQCDCNEGYKRTDDGLSCGDIDECRDIANICDHDCSNIWGSYYCTCNSGYRIATDNRTCLDVDECSEILGHGRLCLGQCVNTRGSFKCDCPSGYKLEPDQRTCRDLDECDGVGICRGSDEICVNTRGSHRCQRITCPENYQRDPNHRNRCKRQKQCLDTDLECRGLPLTYSFNFLPLAANMSLRQTGAVDLFTLRGPLWSSTNNVNFELELEYHKARPGVREVTEKYFVLKRTSFNQVVLTLVKELDGPQEVQLNLNMKLYHNGHYEGSAVAKLLIFVSEYDF